MGGLDRAPQSPRGGSGFPGKAVAPLDLRRTRSAAHDPVPVVFGAFQDSGDILAEQQAGGRE